MFRFLCCAIAVCAAAIGLVLGQPAQVREELAEHGEQQYGLGFETYPQTGSMRTSLVLENNSSIDLDEGLTMAFDVYLKPDNVFGYVFRMVIDGQHNVDLLYSSDLTDRRYPALAVRDSLYKLSEGVQLNRWTPVKIVLAKAANEVIIHYGKARFSYPLDLTRARQVKVAFGKCPFQPFKTSDIASINIRDVVLSRGGVAFRKWKLKEHGENVCMDSLNGIPALVTNGKWLLDKHVKWEKVYTAAVSGNTHFAFDGNQKLYIVQPDSNVIQVVVLPNDTQYTIPVAAGHMVSNSPNQILYDARENRLVSYNLDEKTHAFFSFESHAWSDAPIPTQESTYQNNTGSYSPRDSTIYAFGGYGFFRYNNYLTSHRRFSNEQNSIRLTDIAPRYCAASTIVGDTLYIFGGRGNPSGRQVMNPRNYFDLYAVDLATMHVEKLWDIQEVQTPFLPGEHMVYEENTGYFYVFSDLGGGALMRFNRHEAKIETVSDFIHENLEGLYLYTNLYYSPGLRKMFGVFYKKPDASTYELSIYSIDYPPLAPERLQQPDVSERPESPRFGGGYYLLGLLVLLTGGIFWWLRKRRTFAPTPGLGGIEDVPEPAVTAENESTPLVPVAFKGASICLLGAFKVTDREGQDITLQFTPILKHFLCLLLLNTKNDGKGISVRKLLEYLWPDKPEESAKNNRNVYLSKLRSLSEQVGPVDISYQNEYMNIQIGSEIACDYLVATQLLDEVEGNPKGKQAAVMELLALLLRGELLPGVEAEWLDGFKSSFSDKVIRCLIKLSQNSVYQQSDDLLLTIADILFIHDVLSEEALHIKCSIYYRAGKKGLAKSVYDYYCKGYLNMLGEEFGLSLLDVVNGKLAGR